MRALKQSVELYPLPVKKQYQKKHNFIKKLYNPYPHRMLFASTAVADEFQDVVSTVL